MPEKMTKDEYRRPGWELCALLTLRYYPIAIKLIYSEDEIPAAVSAAADVNTIPGLKARKRYRAQSLEQQQFQSEFKVLFDTFSFKKKYQLLFLPISLPFPVSPFKRNDAAGQQFYVWCDAIYALLRCSCCASRQAAVCAAQIFCL